ncbi:hypothetical protein R1flu_019370 [Riccia fluitans]|uniref:Uncharacterized protein n=1 Tax=Riccia fluitans TaxID=41844 RepID=A0ABD1ZIG0_9MARC
MLVDDATKKKKVKIQCTSMKAFAEAEQIQLGSRKGTGNEPVSSTPKEAKTTKERRRVLHFAAAKSSLKTRLLQGKTSLLVTQRAQHVRKLLPGGGLRLSTPVKRFSRVSFDMDNLKRNLIDLKSRHSRGQEAGGKRLSESVIIGGGSYSVGHALEVMPFRRFRQKRCHKARMGLLHQYLLRLLKPDSG